MLSSRFEAYRPQRQSEDHGPDSADTLVAFDNVSICECNDYDKRRSYLNNYSGDREENFDSHIDRHFKSLDEHWDSAGSGSTYIHPDNAHEEKEDVENKGPTPGPPTPVGFWHSSLAATRRDVFLTYSWTCMTVKALTESFLLICNSTLVMRVRLGRSFDLLGRSVPGQRQLTKRYSGCRRLRWATPAVSEYCTTCWSCCGSSSTSRAYRSIRPSWL